MSTASKKNGVSQFDDSARYQVVLMPCHPSFPRRKCQLSTDDVSGDLSLGAPVSLRGAMV